MKAKQGYRKLKRRSPGIGRWLKRYWEKRTSRKRRDLKIPEAKYVSPDRDSIGLEGTKADDGNHRMSDGFNESEFGRRFH